MIARGAVIAELSCIPGWGYPGCKMDRSIEMGLDPPPLCRLGGQGSSSISDANLLEALAGSNVELRKELEKLLGRDTFEKPAAPAAPTPTVAPTSETKH